MPKMGRDITGMKFGRLMVIQKTDKKPIDRYLWECKCDCGNTVFLPANSITTGNTASCGCSAYVEALKSDLSGKKFNRLLVVQRYNNSKRWICKCDCGNEKIVLGSSLLKNRIKSCGCLNKEVLAERNKNMGTHRMSGTRIYGIWAKMKVRCTCEDNSDYANYGARGIKFHKEWSTFEPFMRWAFDNGYEEHLTLERIDVNGDYEPSNCTWTDMLEQASNKRTSRYITYNGERKTVAQWAKIIGISRQGLRYRLEAGWSLEELLSKADQGKPRKEKNYDSWRKNMLTINGITKPALTWAEEIGITYCSLTARIKKGWTDEELLLPKGSERKKNFTLNSIPEDELLK